MYKILFVTLSLSFALCGEAQGALTPGLCTSLAVADNAVNYRPSMQLIDENLLSTVFYENK